MNIQEKEKRIIVKIKKYALQTTMVETEVYAKVSRL
jgi:hypothetical protein